MQKHHRGSPPAYNFNSNNYWPNNITDPSSRMGEGGKARKIQTSSDKGVTKQIEDVKIKETEPWGRCVE